MIGRGGAIDLHAYYHADAQGNVTTLIHSSGTELANYTYDSFGNLLAASGTWAALNPYRFSSKRADPFGDTYSFGFRFYHPDLQRWLNRDPIGESGGYNLFSYVENNPTFDIDPFGLYKWKDSSLCFADLALNTVNPVPIPLDFYPFQALFGDGGHDWVGGGLADVLGSAGELNSIWEKSKYDAQGGDERLSQMEKELQQKKRGNRSRSSRMKNLSKLNDLRKAARRAGWLGKLLNLPDIIMDAKECYDKGK